MKSKYYSIMLIVGISVTIIALTMTYFFLYLPSTVSGTMNVDGANFAVNYTVTNAKILSMTYFDFRTSSNYPHAIVVEAQPKGNWNLIITMPVSVFGNSTETKAGALSSNDHNTVFTQMRERTSTSATFSFDFNEYDKQITIFYPSQLP